MAKRIHQHENYRTVGVLQVLNEPVRIWEDHEKAAFMIESFYPEAYNRIRNMELSLGIEQEDQLRIQYMSSAWGSGNPKTDLPKDATNLLFDTHRYYAFGKNYTTKQELMDEVCNDRDRPDKVIVGECSMAVKTDNKREFAIQSDKVDIEQQKEWYKGYWGAQAAIYEKAGGWIFWTWKCDLINGYDNWRWCYQSAVRNNVLDKDARAAANFSSC